MSESPQRVHSSGREAREHRLRVYISLPLFVVYIIMLHFSWEWTLLQIHVGSLKNSY